MLGPIPTIDDMQPYIFPNGIAYHFESSRAAELSGHYAELCRELGVPYLDLFSALSDNADWAQYQRDCDGVHAVGDGYAIIADILTSWDAWRNWFAD